MKEKTIPELIENRTKKYGGKILFQRKDGWSWKQVTWLDFENEVKSIASFLIGTGFSCGDSAIILSPNKLESLLTDIAIHLIGGISISFSPKENPELINHALKDTCFKLVFAEDKDTLTSFRKLLDGKRLENIVLFSDSNNQNLGEAISYKTLIRLGMIKKKQIGDNLTCISKSVSPEHVATVLFKSSPEGKLIKVQLTHENLINTLIAVSERLNFICEEDQSFSYLPSTKVFEKLINYLAIFLGIRISMAESRNSFFEDILEVKPTIVFETKKGIEQILAKIPGEPSKKELKNLLGGRIKYIVTDSLPDTQITNLLIKSDLTVKDVPELKSIFD